MLRSTLFAATLATTLFLSGCGGGGDGLPCGGSSTLALGFTYEVNGTLIDPNKTTTLFGGAPVVATPKITGLPASCASSVRLTFTTTQPLPPGMTFDTVSGAFRFTPTVGGFFDVTAKVEVDGYLNNVSQRIRFLFTRVN